MREREKKSLIYWVKLFNSDVQKENSDIIILIHCVLITLLRLLIHNLPVYDSVPLNEPNCNLFNEL